MATPAPVDVMLASEATAAESPPALVVSKMASLPVPADDSTRLESVAPPTDSVRSSPVELLVTEKLLAALYNAVPELSVSTSTPTCTRPTLQQGHGLLLLLLLLLNTVLLEEGSIR